MNQVKDVMTVDPVCCLPSSSLKSVAQLMVDYDCGEIPVVYSMERTKIVGVITDRDICCRSIARGLNPLTLTAKDCMTTPAKIIKMNMSITDCCVLMEEEQIRRLPVVDENENICGMVSLADIALKTEDFRVAPVLKHISEPHSYV